MDRPTFFAEDGVVVWNAGPRTFRLRETEVEVLLNLFDRERDPSFYNTLHDALIAAGGIECVSSLRSAA